MCYKCHEELLPVKMFKKEKVVEVRGLHWCCSTICNCHLYNRDKNSALNILECYRSSERPNYLSRKRRNDDSETKSKGFCFLKKPFRSRWDDDGKTRPQNLVVVEPYHYRVYATA